jgi:Flp pilus assembly protein TadG
MKAVIRHLSVSLSELMQAKNVRRGTLMKEILAIRSIRNPNFRSKAVHVLSIFSSGTRGGALVEFAVTLPLIMLLMTGIFSFSIALYQKMSLSEGLSVGGRVLATDRGDTDPCKTATAAINSASPDLLTANLTLTYILNGVSQGTGTLSCPGASGAANANMVSGKNAQIQVTYKCSLGVYNANFGSCLLAEQVTEVVQ